WVAPRAYEERHHVWDVGWLDNNRLVAAHEKCRAEVWDLARGRVLHDQGDGYGVQVLEMPKSDAALVHVIHRTRNHAMPEDVSELALIDGSALRCQHLRRFKHPYVFSISS